MKGNEKFSNPFLNTPDSKITVKRAEILYKEVTKMVSSEYRQYVEKKLIKKGFNLDRKIKRCENFDSLSVVYTQNKYVIPKRKKNEEA